MENEKDRGGEKMPFVERAGEDIYFAARDRELIEEMQAAQGRILRRACAIILFKVVQY